MSADLAGALRRLPHGPEFRFLDRLLSLDPGAAGVGEYTVRGDEAFLRGHFPGEPLLPGVLLIEAAAQLAGVIAQSHPALPPLPGLKLTAVRGAKILGGVRPGETVRVEARLTGRLGNLVQAQATARVADRLVLQAELTLSGGTEAATRAPPAGGGSSG
jgi:3-hydroxyacyl-[acyl-carrier-protein] dehydratase